MITTIDPCMPCLFSTMESFCDAKDSIKYNEDRPDQPQSESF